MDNSHNSAALYLRLSSDDGAVGDSVSIQTQKMMLTKWCNDQGVKIQEIYVDDGYSGLNFERPDFKRMLRDIEEGKIKFVITKDLSRLGRDYIQTGYYIEIYFPSMKVRYVAINDGIDTNKSDNDIAPFKNILNDMYAKDLSRKVKSAKRQRALSGFFISSQAPYGYMKDPQNKNKLIIDEEAAQVVKRIYEMAMQGLGTKKITNELTQSETLTPAAYKAERGDTRFSRYGDLRGAGWETEWCNVSVQKILCDLVYVGDMENRKYETENYKTKKRVRVSKEHHIIVENTHEPIIDRETYDRVQTLIKARYRPQTHFHENLFKSILFCQECGKRLHLAVKESKGEQKSIYRCMNHFNNPDQCAHYNWVFYEEIKKAVENQVLEFIRKTQNEEELALMIKQRLTKLDKTSSQSESVKIERRLTALSKILRKLYEDYACDILDESNYHQMIKDYQTEQAELNERLNQIKRQNQVLQQKVRDLTNLKEYAKIYINETTLSREMLCKLVERIEIKHAEIIDGQKYQDIKIIYRF